MAETQPLADIRQEGRRIIASAERAGVPLRLTGGVAVALRCRSAAEPPFRRDYKDIDLVGLGKTRRHTIELLAELGYEPDAEFNALYGRTRLLYQDPANGRNLDVIMDQLEMCHVLELKERLLLDPETLTPSDLLLTKLQVVEINERDLTDAAALIHDHDLAEKRIVDVLGADWGWWRTVTANLEQLETWITGLSGFEQRRQRIATRIAVLRDRIDQGPKSLSWKARAKVGERVRWYKLPEEVEPP